MHTVIATRERVLTMSRTIIRRSAAHGRKGTHLRLRMHIETDCECNMHWQGTAACVGDSVRVDERRYVVAGCGQSDATVSAVKA